MRKHFTSTVSIARSTVTGNKTTFATVQSDVPCHIQPMGAVYENGQWGRLQKEYLLFSETEIKIGDKLTDQDSNEYEVFGQQKFTLRGRTHYECQLRGL